MPLVFLPACHRHNRADDDFLDIKVDATQTARALGEMKRFRDAFNAGTCETYNPAGADTRSLGSPDWASECRELHQRLGAWQSFDFEYTERCASPAVVICAVVSAKFEKQTLETEAAWLLRANDAQLAWISIAKDGRSWENYPDLPNRHLIDPPPQNPMRERGASPDNVGQRHALPNPLQSLQGA